MNVYDRDQPCLVAMATPIVLRLLVPQVKIRYIELSWAQGFCWAYKAEHSSDQPTRSLRQSVSSDLGQLDNDTMVNVYIS